MCICTTTTPYPSSVGAIPPLRSGTSLVGGEFGRYAFGIFLLRIVKKPVIPVKTGILIERLRLYKIPVFTGMTERGHTGMTERGHTGMTAGDTWE